MRNRFNLSESEKNYIRGLHGIRVITEQEDEDDIDYSKLIGKGCTEEELALGMEHIPGGGCDCPPHKRMDEEGNCVIDKMLIQNHDDDDIVDDEITDEEIADAPEDEDSWLEERWEDLTDAVRNVFSRIKRLKRCKGMAKCPDFNSFNKNRKRRMLRRLRWRFPRIKWPRIKLFAKK